MDQDKRCPRCGAPLPVHYPPCPAGIGTTRGPSSRPPPLASDDRPTKIGDRAGLVVVLTALAVFGLIACEAKVGPFPPPGPAVYCNSDVACPDGWHCDFTGVDTRAQCLPGVRVDPTDPWGHRLVDGGAR